MRKLGLFAALLGLAILALDLILRMAGAGNAWMWVPGTLLSGAGASLILWVRWQVQPAAAVLPPGRQKPPMDTARFLDNFEQRFAELKTRNPNSAVLGDLYTLAAELEQRNRLPQATAVYRHLVRIDNTYRDVGARLGRLMDAERLAVRAAAEQARSSKPSKLTEKLTEKPEESGEPAEPEPTVTLELGVARLGGVARAAAASGQRTSAFAIPGKDGGGPAIRQLGRYRLEREIGRGAMGVVYLGRDTAINRLVAIKAIPLAG
jgi:serine/threonine-protein kinase